MADQPPGELIIPAEDVAAGLDRLAAQLQPVINKQGCTLIGIMTGGMYPLMQLADRLVGNFLIDYCHATRYAGATRGGDIDWLVKPRLPLRHRTAIIIDDILDEGMTLEAARALCQELGARQVLTAVLAVKDLELASRADADFSTGVVVPDRYVFGCGMDYNEQWRHLDAIYALSEAGPA
jgi:hypoxanthine phosphoribosyltransferase